MSHPTIPGPRLYGWKELHERGISFTNPGLKDLEDSGYFPPRIRISQQRIAWEADAVDNWIQDRINSVKKKQP